VAEAIVRVNARHPDKPLLAVLMGREGLPAGLAELHEANVPAYIFPESAARALGAMWRHHRYLLEPVGEPREFPADDAAVEGILDAAVAARTSKVSEPDALRILEAYQIPVTPWRFLAADDAHDAIGSRVARVARELGFPVALKIVNPAIVHKSDVGGVALGLDSEAAVRRAAETMVAPVAADRRTAGLLVQRMAPSGRETIVGLTRIPGVGAMVMFGLGGVYVEVLRDVALRLAPLLDADARRMIREVRMYPLLEGVRGEPGRDLGALEHVLLRASQLAQRHPRIAEMDINPLFALERGVVAVDARFRVELA
jgi:acetyltransferase